MGRPLRIQAPDLTFHITSRTNGKRLYLRTKPDHHALCRILECTRRKYRASVFKFMPMGNHFHMVIRLGEAGNLSRFMCEFKTAYAKYYNRTYRLSGHFWGDRYRSTIVQDDRHMLACFRYIDRNPVRAGLVKHPREWDYHCFPAYAYGNSHACLRVTLHPTYLAMSEDEQQRRRLYREYITGEDDQSDSLRGNLPRMLFFGSEGFIRELKKRFALN